MHKILKYISGHKKILFLGLLFIIGAIFTYFFRDATADETGYLNEAMIIAQCFKKFTWIGNYPVGIHGFISKIPVAIIFMFTGPSVFWATLTTLMFAIASINLFYLISKLLFKNKTTVYLLCLLFITNFQFLSTATTFLREIPLIFFVFLFLYTILKNPKNNIMIAISLLLILDSKEYVFFILLPVYIFWHLSYFILTEKKPYLLKLFLAILPSILCLYLMFFSSFIPMNLFAASFLKQTHQNIVSSNINTQSILHNQINNTNSKSIINKQIIDKMINQESAINQKKRSIKLITSFSLLPLAVIVVSFVISIYKLKKWHINSQLFFWGYLAVYTLLAPHCKYLFPIIPLSIIYFTYYLKRYSSIMNNTYLKIIFIINIMTLIGFNTYFEISHTLIKLLINLFTLFIVSIHLFIKNKPKRQLVICLAVFFSLFPFINKPIKAITKPELTITKSISASNPLMKFGVILTGYVGKILYPRSFSFLSLPLIIIIVSLIASVYKFREWFINKKYNYLILPLFFWGYLAAYVLFASHNRYLFPIIPISLIFFVYYLEEYSSNISNKYGKIFFIISIAALICFNTYFEESYVLIKLLVNLSLLLLIALLLYIKNIKIKNIIAILTISTVCAVTFSSWLLFSFKSEQIYYTMLFGKNRETKEIAELTGKTEKTWFNNIGDDSLIKFFREDNGEDPASITKQIILKENSHRYNQLIKPKANYTYSFKWGKNIFDFHQLIQENKIEKIIITKSKVANKKFPVQDKIEELMRQGWLTLETTKTLKNKDIYIFSIKNKVTQQNNDSFTVSLNLNKDIGQNLGTIFSINKNSKNFAGAGFIESFSTSMKQNNRLLNFYIKEDDTITTQKVNRGNHTNPYSRLFSTGKKLLTFDQPIEYDTISNIEVYDKASQSFTATNDKFNKLMYVNNKELVFFTNKITYNSKTIYTSENSNSFYYKNGNFYIYTKTTNPTLSVCPWDFSQTAIDVDTCKVLTIPYPNTFPITFGELNGEIIISLDNGILLSYKNDQLKTINPKSENKGQFATTLNYHDRLLLGHFPDSEVYSYDGNRLSLEQYNLRPLNANGRELQTLTIYRGDIYAGVWPWGQLFKNNNLNIDDWKLVKRVFSEPPIYDPSMAPYQNIIQQNFKDKNIETNAWGQKIIDLTPFNNSLFISTGNNSNNITDKNILDFVKNKEEYGAIWELKANSQVSCPFEYKEKTTLKFTHTEKLISIYQDDNLICELPLVNDYENIFDTSQIINEYGVYGKFNGQIESNTP